MSRKGLDASKYQADMSWVKAWNKGYRFAFLRASVGLNEDWSYEGHWAKARNRGFLLGSYHFMWVGPDPVEQAHFFLKHSHDSADLPRVVDVELWDLNEDKVRAFVKTILVETGQHPIIYTRQNLWEQAIGHHLAWAVDYPLWKANEYLPDSWQTWVFKQTGLTQVGKVDVDTDVYHGTIEELRARIWD